MAEDGTAAAVNVSGTATGSNSVSRNSVVAEASRGKRIVGHATLEADPSDGVVAMMGRLKLTSRKAKTLVMDDEDDAKGCPDWAIVGKVLAPNPLHIETIKAVLRPAWGNPKGMIVRPMGSNLFLAELESKADRDRIMKGGPWMMGKNAILLKEFDPRIKSADVVFDSLLVWARIHNLPYNLMNTERGTPLAGMIGRVEFLDVDENGRAWGEYLRARVQVDVAEPLMRCVAVGSSRLRTTVYYEVKYEKLPMYCFSCGLIGHSSLVCPTPASRDEDGKLPWDSDRVCIPDQKKKEQRSSSHGLKRLEQGQSASSNFQGPPHVYSEVSLYSPVARQEHFLFPCLDEIDIRKCHSLTGFLVLLPSLKKLIVSECHELKSVELSHSGEMPSLLEYLKIEDCKTLLSLPDGPQAYSSLRKLKIKKCPAIKRLPTCLQQRLSSLEKKKLDGRYEGTHTSVSFSIDLPHFSNKFSYQFL
ncbi:hypothetical protein ACQ4PT_037791 [Festuca glaucescens]